MCRQAILVARFIKPAVTAFVVPVSGSILHDLATAAPALARGGYATVVADAGTASPTRGVAQAVYVAPSECSSDACFMKALRECAVRGHEPGRVAMILDGDASAPWPWAFSQSALVESAWRAGSRAIVLRAPAPVPAAGAEAARVLGLPGCGLIDVAAALVSGVHGTSCPYSFGPHGIPASHVFASSLHAFALVNLKPVTNGHALVVSRRSVTRFRDLAPAEVADLWSLAQAVSSGLEAHFRAHAATIVLQDGAAAGQTVPHVHVHVLPRHEADLANNDDVYGMVRQWSSARCGELSHQPPGGLPPCRLKSQAKHCALLQDRRKTSHFRRLPTHWPLQSILQNGVQDRSPVGVRLRFQLRERHALMSRWRLRLRNFEGSSRICRCALRAPLLRRMQRERSLQVTVMLGP